MDQPACIHLDQITEGITPNTPGVCEECSKTGDQWVHLRMCLTCGKVGCCDSSKNQHARKHYEEEGHALIQSAQPSEDWQWCYIEEVYL